MVKVLHITPHMGGGVGRVLTNYLVKNVDDPLFRHNILSLDSINIESQAILNKFNIGFRENVSGQIKFLIDKISLSDIVVIHWWNHPLLFELLVKTELPPCRIVIWSHVSGNSAPQVFSHTLFDYADFFIFTTPISYLSLEVKTYSNHSKLKTIWATGGLEHIKGVVRKQHKEFIIGYIGTVDFSKMYERFILLCEKIDIPNIKFIICGDGNDIEKLKNEVLKKNIKEKFIFTGFVSDIKPYLEYFDIFGYPLNKDHYGTCDQVLAEAMGCGIIPIVFDNPMESYMVDDLYSGIVVRNEEEYINAVMNLYQNKNLRKKLSKKAREESFRRFSIDNTINQWDETFKNLLNIEKIKKQWNGKYSGTNVTAYEIFLESIGSLSKVFNDEKSIKELSKKSLIWKSKTKGTVHHYLRFFQEDKKLQYWSSLME